MNWKVYYIDGTTFSSEEGLPKDAPRTGVALIVHYPDGSRKVEWYHDTYCWEHDMWIPHDRYACDVYINDTPEPVRLLGYAQPNDKFQAIYEAAKDPNGPVTDIDQEASALDRYDADGHLI